TVLDLLSWDDRDELVRRWAAYLDGERARERERGPREMVGERKDGTPIAIELTMTELMTREGRLFTALVRDLSEHKAFERELEHLATHDPLTGLPNRTFLVAQLESALLRASRHGTSVGVLMVEVDRVKLVTEALGHRAGDELIQQAANRLRATA